MGEHEAAPVGAEGQRADRVLVGEPWCLAARVDTLPQRARRRRDAVGDVDQPDAKHLLRARHVRGVPHARGDRHLRAVGRHPECGDDLVLERIDGHRLPRRRAGSAVGEAGGGRVGGEVAVVRACLVVQAIEPVRVLGVAVAERLQRPQRDERAVGECLRLPACREEGAVAARRAVGFADQCPGHPLQGVLGVVGGNVPIAGEQEPCVIGPPNVVVIARRREGGLAPSTCEVEGLDARAAFAEGFFHADQPQPVGREVGVEEVAACVHREDAWRPVAVGRKQRHAISAAFHRGAGGVDRTEVLVAGVGQSAPAAAVVLHGA